MAEEVQEKPINSPQQELSEQPQAKKHNRLVNAAHWGITFVVIGWALNTFLSVKVWSLIKEKKPAWVNEAEKRCANWFVKIGKIIKNGEFTDKSADTAVKMAKDLVEIVGLGSGGFLVLPIQKLYTANRDRVSYAVKNGAESIVQNDSKNSEKKEAPKEKKESLPHWISARLIAFVAGCSAYILVKYTAGNRYKQLNEKLVEWSDKLPRILRPKSNETEFFLADQITLVTGIATLSIAKHTLDKVFPSKEMVKAEANSSSEKRSQMLAAGPKSPTEHILKDNNTTQLSMGRA